MAKNLLHISRIEEFKEWMNSKGIEWRDPRGDYQVIQIKIPNNTQWACVYERGHMPEHYTTDYRIDGIVHKFIKDTK